MFHWRRTLYTVWFTQFIALLGFSFVLPFIPYYVRELGVGDSGQVTLWAGLVTAAQPAALALMSPLWGILSDRYGYKIMVVRATFAGAAILALMGFVTDVGQLLVLRILQGALSGTIPATTTLVASSVPRERSGMVLGSLQTAIYLGISLGPLLGGVAGDAFGYRTCFWVTGALLFVSGLLVVFLVSEAPSQTREKEWRQTVRWGQTFSLLTGSGGALLSVLAVRVLLRAGPQFLSPVLPLFVEALLPRGAHIATVAGLVTGVSAAGTALGSSVIGSLGDRLGHRRLLVLSSLAAGAMYLPQAFVREPAWLAVWQFMGGFTVGGTLSTLTALLAEMTPHGYEGMVFGLDSSAMGVSNTVGPMLGAGAAAVLGLGAPFILAAMAFIVGTLLVLLWVREGLGQVFPDPPRGALGMQGGRGAAIPRGCEPPLQAGSPAMSEYASLGVVSIINAEGTMTKLGGSRLLPQAAEAMGAVSQEFVDLDALLDAAGAKIAQLTRTPAACVCAGAAAGIALAVAACMTGDDLEKVRRLPDARGMRGEVVLDGAQDNPFVHAILPTGARVVQVGSRSSPMCGSGLEAALSEGTAAVMSFVAWAHAEGLSLAEVIATAHAAGVPVVVDAAAQLPPVDNLWRYTEMGADLVIFSGGKDIRGPQASGFILGRPDLVRACRLNGSPNEETICRGMKISKEGIVGLVVALEHYLGRDFPAEMAGYERLVARMGAMLAGVKGLVAYRVCPGAPDIQPNIIPRLHVDPAPALGLGGEELARRLWQGDPPISVATSPTGIIINPQTLTEGEAMVVVRRLREEVVARAG